jgi:RND superfamily putative drug exporter
LALAIDYTLLIVSRFRDELAEGADRNRALVRTMATAGRTVLFSAMTVALSMVAMLLFPMYFLKSFAYAGVAVVAFAAVAAVAVTPAAIVLLGDRLDSWDVRRLGRRLLRRPEPVRRPVEQIFFYRSTKFVMRHAIAIGLAIIVLLLILGAPFLNIRWGFPDDRVLPGSASARQVGDQVRNDFAIDSSTNVAAMPRSCPRFRTCRRCRRLAARSLVVRWSGRRQERRSRTAAPFSLLAAPRHCSRRLRRPSWTGCTPSPVPAANTYR